MIPDITEKLESIYDRYNRRRFVDPDPLLYLYDYPDVRDRETAGLVAACLAYGRVELIMETVGRVLGIMGPRPAQWAAEAGDKALRKSFRGFVYRFAREDHLVSLILGIQGVIRRFGSLEDCFMAGMPDGDNTTLAGLTLLSHTLDPHGRCGHLLADPAKTSACKRSHLFLRWMVRQDAVDPGGWDRVGPEKLLIPLDTHMYKAGQILGFTRRKAADRRTVLDITAGFRQINPHDPVKYDFCLTRFGIQRQMGMDELAALLENGSNR